jgi:hypothetical protein
MNAVWMRLGAELRGRWRAWLALALLTGVFGGAVLAAGIGAARTSSVVDRSIARSAPPDIFFIPLFGIQELDQTTLDALSFDRLIALPSVADGERFTLMPPQPDELDVYVPGDARFGREIFRPKILEGRLPDPDEPLEAFVNAVASDRLGLHAGDRFSVEFYEKFQFPGEPPPPAGPTVTFRITGVSATLGDVSTIAGPGIFPAPSFRNRFADQIEGIEMSMLRLRNGTRSYGDLRHEIEGLTGGKTVFYVESGDWPEARRSFRLQAVSLWILTAILGFVTVLVLGQTIARQTFLDSGEHPVLRSLGLSDAQLIGLGVLRSGVIGLAAAAVAIAVATAASPLAPFGNARLADPDPAFSFPVLPMLMGGIAVVIVVVALAILPALRASRAASRGLAPAEQDSGTRPARLAELLSRSVRAPTAGIGVRMALEPGRGRTAVPVRTTISATAVALVALTAALVVGTSLDRLATTPRLYGWNWDVAVVSPCFNDDAPEEICQVRAKAAREEFGNIDGIAEVTFGPEGGQVLINGTQVEPYGLPVGAAVHPPILDGREPRATDELLLARKTLADLDVSVGDTVKFGFQGAPATLDFRVVGVTVLPVASDVSTLGEGAWVPIEDLGAVFQQLIPLDRALVRFERGADRAGVIGEIERQFAEVEIQRAEPPGTVVDFGRVSNMPSVLAGIVALLAAGTLAHGLGTGVRRRRRDLAILKSLGLDRGQVRRAVAWQATAITILTVAIGLPLGVVVGRAVWKIFADQTGFLAETSVGPGTVALIVPAALILANAIAALPGRAAARTQPAPVLRSE